ncbi:gas vesicle protein K [Leifsonia shinshuensis]|uniref:FtsZ-binding cell division protein ZapB n=1 Tax=Leifsonia shinshuensis TaxID=150026 RepID=A0A853CPT6_9MICO|nr:gas vesicle protein K [Leifsonia shinshuensis]NYJ22319.1 FtsZ-binding cell division protein ZapB [Leifsonia shinshuensis]
MALNVDEDSLKNGVLTLVVTLVEVIQQALETQALRRLEGGSLTEEEQNRLGEALLELDRAMEQLKNDNGITESVAELHSSLDDVVDDLVRRLVDPESGDGEPGRGLPWKR